MKDIENLIYYSVNCYIAHYINETYYDGIHFVWASPVYNSKSLAANNILKNIPPSSNPFDVYNRLLDDINLHDGHCAKIDSVKLGLKKGATIKLNNKTISDKEFETINYLIDKSPKTMYRPLLYVIPKHKVQHKLLQVEVEKIANPFGIEYQIHDLRSEEFEIIETTKL